MTTKWLSYETSMTFTTYISTHCIFSGFVVIMMMFTTHAYAYKSRSACVFVCLSLLIFELLWRMCFLLESLLLISIKICTLYLEVSKSRSTWEKKALFMMVLVLEATQLLIIDNQMNMPIIYLDSHNPTIDSGLTWLLPYGFFTVSAKLDGFVKIWCQEVEPGTCISSFS